MMSQMRAGGRGPAVDEPVPDTAETIHISSLALLKMLKHGAWQLPAYISDFEMPGLRFRQWRCRFCFHSHVGRDVAARAGVPLEVMGLMLGEFVDEYTVQCVDVFAMPQSGTSVSVESVDPVFQQQMMEMLKQTGRSVSYIQLCCAFRHVGPFCWPTVPVYRPEIVVGWYHSHPGFGCWLSGTDVGTQKVGVRVV